MNSTLTARPLSTAVERLDAVRLYRSVFGLGETEPAVAPKLLCALARHGGSAVGAFEPDGRMVGFAYGFTGLDAGLPYHHSQAAVVEAGQQGRGIGRLLKRAQAEVAARTGVSAMRWAYDPMEARNAHFNLDVLGATGRWFHRAYFGPDHPGDDRADRIVVEWPLGEVPDRAHPPLPSTIPVWGQCLDDSEQAWLAIPARWSDVTASRAAELRDDVADHLEQLLGAGRVLLSCRRADPSTAVYLAGESA